MGQAKEAGICVLLECKDKANPVLPFLPVACHPVLNRNQRSFYGKTKLAAFGVSDV
jgi:hypothetical protein